MSDRFTLRQLPLPAKLVVSAFLISVGLGYFSAMVQLHMKHGAKDGNPLPGPVDVIEVFSGMKPYDATAEEACGCMDRLIAGDINAADVGKDNMAPAFKAKSKGWANARGGPRGGVDPKVLDAERDGERLGMQAWARLKNLVAKKTAHENDLFELPPELKDQPITKDFLDDKGNLKIATLIEKRCQNCHKEQAPPLGTYAEIAAFANPPEPDLIAGKWVRSNKQTSVEKLTQSTHAHLLSFAVLFALTGLTFAFTGYPAFLRAAVGTGVLVAQMCDVLCWWLARLPAPFGPNFALAIMGTGAAVGLGLSVQIVGGLFSMYGPKGKILVLSLLAGGAAIAGYVGVKVIKPELDHERAVFQAEQDKKLKAKQPSEKQAEVAQVPSVVPAAMSQIEKLVTAERHANDMTKFNGKGTMAPAFFDQNSEYKTARKRSTPAELKGLEAKLDGERFAMAAWARLADEEARRRAYEDNAFPLPAELQGKPISEDFLDGTAVKMKDMIEARCAWCHAKGADQEDYPLTSYAEVRKYLLPKPAK